MNFSNFTAGDWFKVVANVTGAAAAGFAAGGYIGAIVTALAAFGTLMQTPPAHVAVPQTK